MLQDQLGITWASTDASGAVVGTFGYDPHGRATSAGTTPAAPGVSGEYTDAETGFVYLRARYYDPVTGQFLSRDPLVALTGSAYGYAGGNPLNLIDPMGLASLEALGGTGRWLRDRAADLGCLGQRALDNGFLRGVAAAIAVATVCTTGIGCALLVGGLTGGGLGALNYYVNDKEGPLAAQVAVGTVKGATSGATVATWGVLTRSSAGMVTTGQFFRTTVPGSLISASVIQGAKRVIVSVGAAATGRLF